MANKSGGLASGCLWLFGGLIVLSAAIYAIAIALFVAIGVGLWFGIRYIWRRLVIEAPNSKIVKMGMKLPPIGRKVSAGIASALVVFVLMGLFGQTTSTNTQVEQPAPSSNSAIEQPTRRIPLSVILQSGTSMWRRVIQRSLNCLTARPCSLMRAKHQPPKLCLMRSRPRRLTVLTIS